MRSRAGSVALASRLTASFKLGQSAVDLGPECVASWVRIMIRISNRRHTRPEPKTVENNLARLRHRRFRALNGIGQLFERRFDQQCVMVWRADRNACLGGQTARKAEHFGAVRLRWKISQKARIGIGINRHAPTENGLQLSMKIGLHFDTVGPAPEFRVFGAVFLKHEPRLDYATANLTRKAAWTDTVENTESAGFERLATAAIARRRVVATISLC